MFGYIVADVKALPEDAKARFRGFYCGLCRTLKARHGLRGMATLSFDMTFLALLLDALYEPDERKETRRCALHPAKKRPYVYFPAMDYVADINVALSYHKCLDNWIDDKSVVSRSEAALLEAGYRRVEAAWPEACAAIVRWLDEIHRTEERGEERIDPPVNATGVMLGELFSGWRQDIWQDPLRRIGDGLGRFIYFMDAYEDLPQDIRRKRFNPLKPLRDREDYEELCRSAMMMMAGDATQAFEELPIVQDADILRNILYSGIWSRYAFL